METPYGIFVTGTDTSVGKTLVASALLRAFALSGLRAVGMKPVATGCRADAPDRANEDVASLIAASNVSVPVDLINPYCFEPAVAPHLAAQQAGNFISLAHVRECYLALAAQADRVVVEGAGGLLVPLSAQEDFSDLVRALELSVVLVVGMRLGCLNHALLTAEAIHSRGLPFAGWVANRIDSAMPFFEDNLETLRQRLSAPLIAVMPFAPNKAQACAVLNLGLLAARHP
ncbi:MAG: dethiobiotin synthase [Prolixibacteraceae bacterium]|nr:dethiobiotin synthase [Burkholderiales bacterium]